ncbi:MAG: hypothetical protein K0Q51_1595 [Rickettsiaceae bacterium]|jgi:hypothetical protein|nr:hypothetical protein [Rickettsiaceae bacterium]
MHNFTKYTKEHIISALIFASGIALAGYFIGSSFLKARLQDRYVVVKGLSEREITSNLAIWPITIKATGNNLTEVNSKIESDRKTLINFLKECGFNEEEIEIGTYTVTDLLAQEYGNNISEKNRYIINASVIVKSANVNLVEKATQMLNRLVQKDIVLASERGPFYEFTGFNDLKPQMLEEAIKNAHKSAYKFAEDSGNNIGSLRKANQGIFLFSPAVGEETDEYSNSQAARRSVRKKVRLVTTLEYFLKD